MGSQTAAHSYTDNADRIRRRISMRDPVLDRDDVVFIGSGFCGIDSMDIQ